MKKVRIKVTNADDGVDVYRNGNRIFHVHFKHEADRTLLANEGDTIAFVIINLTGGDWMAHFQVFVDGEEVFRDRPTGWSLPNPEAWKREITV